jgi:sulfate adenylyltransferase subunit 2
VVEFIVGYKDYRFSINGMKNMENYSLGHLDRLESESIHILREVAAEFENPVILYSIGKDSSVLTHLASKAFFPDKISFPFLHIDTGFKFDEMYQFRDSFIKQIGAKLIVHKNDSAMKEGASPYTLGTQKCCGALKTDALLQALSAGSFDAAIGGARRDEEKSRAKERVYSFRDKHGQWDPKNQRPELWNTFNGRLNPGESIRAFPISNWTEIDIWHYIYRENIAIVPLYFAKKRKMVQRGSQLIPVDSSAKVHANEDIQMVMSRFRTLGCSPCTGAIKSDAGTIPEIIEELLETRSTERSTRIIDHDSDASMENKKREGYF